MGFLRRLVGGGPEPDLGTDAAASDDPGEAPVPDEDEITRNRDLLREEADRLDDELLQRQLRYADRSWVPPTQGSSQRSGDEGAPES